MLSFILGAMLGAILGVALMCCLIVGAESDRDAEIASLRTRLAEITKGDNNNA